MHLLKGDLFNYTTHRLADGSYPGTLPRPDAICITTNGFVKKNGECVMGRGCAKRAAELMPGLPEILGNAISSQGNKVYAHGPLNNIEIVTFPVKPIAESYKANGSNIVQHMRTKFKPGNRVPGWACKASIGIIITSATQLKQLTDERGWTKVVLPRPGCGAGELNWDEVYPVLHGILDERFYCITF